MHACVASASTNSCPPQIVRLDLLGHRGDTSPQHFVIHLQHVLQPHISDIAIEYVR